MTLSPQIAAPLESALNAKGYETLTAVQLQVIAPETAGRDLLVSAQTGSGKTVAFGLAIAPDLLGDGNRLPTPHAPLALIIAPTRELAMQVQRELTWLYGEAGAVLAAGVGGMDIRTERRAFERGAHIVVGTPGRLRDHITKHALDLSAIKAVVLDEADEMLDLGFREDLEFILAAAPDERRTLMFSATVPRPIADLAESFQHDALRLVAESASEPHADIEYVEMVVRADEREHAVVNTLLLYETRNAIIFCHTREAVKHMAARLANRGFAVVALSGELTQAERTSALQAMRDGRARICVATDVAARGIDLPNLDLVIHADVPGNPDTLLHRSGRTGRAGRKGTCVLIVPRHRRAAVSRTLNAANVRATARGAPGIAEIEKLQREMILSVADAIPAPSDEEQAMVGELLARLSPEQLAAAWLRAEQTRRPAAEDVSDEPVSAASSKPQKKRFDDEGPFEPREPRASMTGSRWFTLSLGRKQRADPKWLLPMICKAGGVSRRAVGSIKIGDAETRFEISADEAEAFSAQIARNPVAEGNVLIQPAGEGSSSRPAYAKSSGYRDAAPAATDSLDNWASASRRPAAKPDYKKPDYKKPDYKKPAYDRAEKSGEKRAEPWADRRPAGAAPAEKVGYAKKPYVKKPFAEKSGEKSGYPKAPPRDGATKPAYDKAKPAYDKAAKPKKPKDAGTFVRKKKDLEPRG